MPLGTFPLIAQQRRPRNPLERLAVTLRRPSVERAVPPVAALLAGHLGEPRVTSPQHQSVMQVFLVGHLQFVSPHTQHDLHQFVAQVVGPVPDVGLPFRRHDLPFDQVGE